MIKTYPWHDQIWQSLLACCNEKRMPHALLFSGSAGLGKYEFALRLAHFLLCNNSTTEACNTCVSCKLLEHNSHPDLWLLGSEEEMIKVDQIREFTQDLTHTPHQGKMMIGIINHAHLLNIAAANALLKTLEEPAAHVVIILLSDHPSFLPATIRSRCQNISFSPPVRAIAKSWLMENLAAPADADLLLNLAENAPLKALSLAPQLTEREKFLQDVFVFSGGKLEFNKFIVNNVNYSWEFIFSNLISLVLDLIKLQRGIEPIINQDKKDILSCFKTDQAKLFAYCNHLFELNKFINENINLNKQLLLENVWLDWLDVVGCI